MYKIFDSRYPNLDCGVIEETQYLSNAKYVFLAQVSEVCNLSENDIEQTITVQLLDKDGSIIQCYARSK